MRAIEKKISLEFNLPQEKVHEIITFCYEHMREILKTDMLQYEITGLGSLEFVPRLAKKYLSTEHKYADEEKVEVINKKLTRWESGKTES